MQDRKSATCDKCGAGIDVDAISLEKVRKVSDQEIVLLETCPNCSTENKLLYSYKDSIYPYEGDEPRE